MTTLTGSFRDIAGRATVGSVRIYSQDFRASATPGQMVTREVWHGVLAEGGFRAEGLEPGPAVVELHGASSYESIPVVVPDEGTHDISVLVSEQVEWTPAVVGAAQLAAREAAEYLAKAVAAADRAASSASNAASSASSAATQYRLAQAHSTVALDARDEVVQVKSELEQRILDLEASLTKSSHFANSDSGAQMALRRHGKTVMCRVINAIEGDTWEIPEGYRPAETATTLFSACTRNGNILMLVTSNRGTRLHAYVRTVADDTPVPDTKMVGTITWTIR